MAVWLRRQTYILPRALFGNYVDDCMMATSTAAERQLSMDESDKFDRLTGQCINLQKTKSFSAFFSEPGPAEQRTLFSKGSAVQEVTAEKLLGILISCDGHICAGLQNDRVEKAAECISLVAKVPIPLHKKANLLSVKTAGARYGLELAEPSDHVCSNFDQRVLGLLCGPRQLRCKATSFALSWAGHRLFLELATPYQSFVMAAKQVARHSSVLKLFVDTWQARLANNNWNGDGICAHLQRQCIKLGWKWDAATTLSSPTCGQIRLAPTLHGWFKHKLREWLRQAAITNITSRKDLTGLENGINYQAAVKLLAGSSINDEEKN